MKKRNNRPPIRATVETAQMDSIERWGNDVETAVKLALEELQLTEDQVTVEVLEEPSKGFFGIGAKLAKVKVTRKVAVPKEEKKGKPEKKNWGPIRKEEVTEEEKAGAGSESRNDRDRKNKNGKNNKNNKNKGGKNGKGGKGKGPESDYTPEPSEEPIVPVVDRSTLKDLEENNEGLVFLKKLIEEMGLDVTAVGMTDGTDLYFFIEGKDSGTIIGKRGATLDAIQYLASLVVNKGEGEYIRVVVDAENYRAKREKSLEKLAMRLGDKVAKTQRSYKLEPMNPYERKVIHSTLQKDPRVTTKSEGQDPSRRIVLEPK